MEEVGTVGAFFALERAVLRAIVAQCPELGDGLRAQLGVVRVVRRHNSGAGFFTDLAVDRGAVGPIASGGPFGSVWAEVEGIAGLMIFLVFAQEGYVSMLEGAVCGDGGTERIDFSRVGWRMLDEA